MEREDFLNKYTKHLNAQQLEAVQSVYGPVLLLSVPGSGKTTVLVHRLAYMILCENINPNEILTLTYTVAATQDMKKRFESIFGNECGNNLEFRTINGICAKIITQYGQMIGKEPFKLISDEKDTTRVLTGILANSLPEYPTESDIKNAKTLITYCKNMLLSDDAIDELGEEEDIPLLDIYKSYNAYLRERKLMDYDDQMIYAYKLLKNCPELLTLYKNKYKFICVDEAQDTSKIQHTIIDLIAGKSGNLFMVGDEDQSIYGFRGAYPKALLYFEKNHTDAKVIVMDRNYRSNANIVIAASKFIKNNKDRHEKSIVATRDAGSDINFIELKARGNQYGYLFKVANGCQNETAVLFRDNESALPLIDQLYRHEIPFQMKVVDMGFFTNRVVLDTTNILKFALNPYDTSLFMQIYYKCQTYLKKAQAEELCQISIERNIPVLNAIDFSYKISSSSIKQCKSLRTHLRNMLNEAPAKALYRIENPLGYREYLERSSIDANKLFTLKALALSETSIAGFLNRLDYLQERIKNNPRNDCPFILSTIHSSKGLEYDNVYLIDVCDGMFPKTDPWNFSDDDYKNIEEERRLFYVGITRARNNLNIFTYKDTSSSFIKAMRGVNSKTTSTAKLTPASIKKRIDIPYSIKEETQECNINIKVGSRVQSLSGTGTIIEIMKKGDNIKSFIVSLDDGDQKTYAYPKAFSLGMKLI